MEQPKDVRWQQRFFSYEKTLAQLTEFTEHGGLNKREILGLIKCFEYNYELAWALMKDYLEFQGFVKIGGSRDAIRTAFKYGLIEDGENWMEMLEDRIKSVHTYNQETADRISAQILAVYYQLFIDLRNKIKTLF